MRNSIEEKHRRYSPSVFSHCFFYVMLPVNIQEDDKISIYRNQLNYNNL